MKRLFQIAFRNLIQSRQRTALLGFAFCIVSLLLVLLLSLSQGVSQTMRDSATILVSGHVNVAGFYKAKADDSFPLVTRVPEIEALVKEHLGDQLNYLVIRQRGWGKIISSNNRIQVSIHGVEIEKEPGLLTRLIPAPENTYKENGTEEVKGNIDDLKERNTIALFSGQAKKLEVGIGDLITMTTESLSGRVNTKDVRVVSILKDVGFMSNWTVFTHAGSLKDLYQLGPKTAGALMIYLKDINDAEAAMEGLRKVLASAGHELMAFDPNPFWRKFNIVAGEDWTGQKLDLTLWENEVSFLKWAIKGLDGVSFLLITILLVIIAIGIINTMLMSVRERTREIGSLRAIGMHRRQVLLMFLFEALILGLASTTFGCLLGALLATTLNAAQLTIPSHAVQAVLLSETLHLVVDPRQLLQTIGLFTLFAVTASIIPASRAARMEPVKAIHHIG